MSSATPQLHLETLFVLGGGRILSTREAHPSPGPAFVLVRGTESVSWAVRDDVAADVAGELGEHARREPPTLLREPPIHALRYQALLRGPAGGGPAFEFPDSIKAPAGVVSVHDEAPLHHHFSGWVAGEIEGGCSPMMAVSEDGHPVSVCFCARRSADAAEAGLEAAADFRGRGYAPRVTAAWALAVRALSLIPLYSTDWSNGPSLAVARKLDLKMYATNWSIKGTETA